MPGGEEEEGLHGVRAKCALCIQSLQIGLVAARSLVSLPRSFVQLCQLVQGHPCMPNPLVDRIDGCGKLI